MISYVDKGVLVSKSGADECRGNRTDIKDRYEQEGDNEMEFSNSQWFYVPDHVSCVHVLVYSERNTVM